MFKILSWDFDYYCVKLIWEALATFKYIPCYSGEIDP